MNLVQYVESNTATAHHALLEQLKEINLKDFNGENVKMCTEQLSTLCRRLDLADELPKNISMLTCDAMVTCSVEEFCVPFMTLRSEFDLDLKYKTWTELVIIADRQYQSLLDSEKWIKVNPDRAGAAFAAEGLVHNNSKTVKCFNCGQQHTPEVPADPPTTPGKEAIKNA